MALSKQGGALYGGFFCFYASPESKIRFHRLAICVSDGLDKEKAERRFREVRRSALELRRS